MNLIEISYPRGTVDQAERERMASSIVSAITGGGTGAPEETMRHARRMIHIAFREMDAWSTGDGPVSGDNPPPFVVTVTVPETWRTEVSRYMTGVMRAAIGRYDAGRGYVRDGGDIWVNTIGVQDGSIGLNGKASTAADVLDYMTEEFRAKNHDSQDLPDGVVVDPICGMHVRLGPKAITLDHNGNTVGFCSHGCRDAYARHQGIGRSEAS